MNVVVEIAENVVVVESDADDFEIVFVFVILVTVMTVFGAVEIVEDSVVGADAFEIEIVTVKSATADTVVGAVEITENAVAVEIGIVFGKSVLAESVVDVEETDEHYFVAVDFETGVVNVGNTARKFPVSLAVMVELEGSVYKETVVDISVAFADYFEVVIVFGILAAAETAVAVVSVDVGNVGAVKTVDVVQIVSVEWTAVVLVTVSDSVEAVSAGNVDVEETAIVEFVAHVFEIFVMTLNVFEIRNVVVLIAVDKTVLTLKSVVLSENHLVGIAYLVFCLVAAD